MTNNTQKLFTPEELKLIEKADWAVVDSLLTGAAALRTVSGGTLQSALLSMLVRTIRNLADIEQTGLEVRAVIDMLALAEDIPLQPAPEALAEH